MQNGVSRRRGSFLLIRACVILYTEQMRNSSRFAHGSFQSAFQHNHFQTIARCLDSSMQDLKTCLQSRRRRYQQTNSNRVLQRQLEYNETLICTVSALMESASSPGATIYSPRPVRLKVLITKLAATGFLDLSVSCAAAFSSNYSLES
jgi:hypothetical protein